MTWAPSREGLARQTWTLPASSTTTRMGHSCWDAAWLTVQMTNGFTTGSTLGSMTCCPLSSSSATWPRGFQQVCTCCQVC